MVTNSAADNHNNCANYDQNMKFLSDLVQTIRFIFRSGSKSDLISEDCEGSMTSITLKLTFLYDSGAVCLFCESLERYVMIICCT